MGIYILSAMIVSLFAAMVLSLGQISSAPGYGTPHEFQMKNGKSIYGLADKTVVENPRTVSFDYRIEEPWNRLSETRTMKKRDYDAAYQEADATYRRRIKNEWAAHGGKNIGTPQAPKWVLETEYELAERALAMTNPVKPASVEQGGSVPDGTLLQESESVGFVRQWWIHGVIGITVIVLMAASIWWGFLRRNWGGIGS
jgi:hypothetical protein